jgi:diguanylate cyclase (GGDEF)-like protein
MLSFSYKRYSPWLIFTCLYITAGLAVLFCVNWLFHSQLNDFIDEHMNRAQMEIELQEELLKREMTFVASDIYFLCHTQEIKNYLNAPDETTYTHLLTELISFVNERGIYDQVRLLDTDGREVARINQINDHTMAIPQDELQDKSHRGYFQHCTQLHRGEVYVSSIDLNQEYMQIEKPYKPVVRLGMAVYDGLGKRKGYMILNYLVKDYLNIINKPSITRNNLEFMMVTDDGYWAAHSNPAKQWGWLLPDRSQENFANDYPQLWPELNKQSKGRFDNGKIAMSFNTINFRIREEMVVPRSLASERLPVDDLSYRSTAFKIVGILPARILAAKRRALFHEEALIWTVHLILSILPLWGLSYLIHVQYQRHLELAHRAHYDKVTDLPNRDLFLETLEITRQKAAQTQSRFAVLYIDLDGFKPVNDTLGHSCGDDVLALVGRRLLKCIRQSDMVARIGGDEFAVILSRIAHVDDASRVAEKIRQQVKAPYVLAQNVAHLSCSVGWAVYPDQSENIDQLLELADQQMYRDKQSHKKLKLTRECPDDSQQQRQDTDGDEHQPHSQGA